MPGQENKNGITESMNVNPKSNIGIKRRRGATKSSSNPMTLISSVFVLVMVVLLITMSNLFSSSAPPTVGRADDASYLRDAPIYLGDAPAVGAAQIDDVEYFEDAPVVDSALSKKARKRSKQLTRGGGKRKAMGEAKAKSYDKGENNVEVKALSKNWDAILRAEVHLVDLYLKMGSLSPGSKRDGAAYGDVEAVFCRLDWDLHKNDPPSVPMFKVLVSKSGCNDKARRITVDLATAVRKAREYDELIRQRQNDRDGNGVVDGFVHSLTPKGFVFHESRVGSTLVANSLAAMNPDGHRVYSEAGPSIAALRACYGVAAEKCDPRANVELYRDVVYVMGRSNSPSERLLFFKNQSIGTKSINVFRRAFPDAPWIFVYRDPVQTMMSHISGGAGVCLRAKRNPPNDLKRLVKKSGKQLKSLSDEEFCAVHLASLCESALEEMRNSATGKAIEYEGLIDSLIDSVIPKHFRVKLDNDGRQRILDVSGIYSKSRNEKGSRKWVEDNEKKEKAASNAVLHASKLFMTKSYNELKKFR